MAPTRTPGPDLGPPEVVAHGAALRSLARALVGEQGADDAVQETWVRYLERRPAAGGFGWLSTVLRRLVSNDRRDTRRRENRERDTARPEAIDEGALREKDETLRGVVEAVFALEPAYREVVMLRWFEGLPPRDIAARLGLEPHVVHTRLSRAHSKLREKLDRELGTQRALSGLCALAGIDWSWPVPWWAVGGKGVVLVASKLAMVSGATAVVLCGAVWLALSGGEQGDPAHAQVRPEEAAEPNSTRFDDAARPAATPDLERSEAPSAAVALTAADLAPWAAPAFEYELDVGIVDSLDLPRDRQTVYAAPAGHTLNELGETDENGQLVLHWRGFQPTMELDVALDTTGGARRVRVSAGSQRLALRTSSSRSEVQPNVMTFEVVVSGKQLQTIGDFFVTSSGSLEAVACRRDEQGRILWVEPNLCEAPEIPEQVEILTEEAVSGLFTARVRNVFLSEAVELSAEVTTGRIVGRVLDREGKPVEGAMVVARRTGSTRWPAERTDADGRFELADLAPADWTLAAGGGDLGRAHRLATVTPGATLDWTAQLDRGMELKGRLLGPEGVALADWVIEIENDDPLEPLCDATRTDSEGRFAIPNLPPRTLRVLARPSDRSRGFALVVATGVLPGEADLELVASLHELDARGSISATISDLEGHDPHVARVTAWRDDTGRGTPGESTAIAAQVATSKGEEPSAVETEPTQLALDGLGPGWHTLEIALRGRAPLVVPRIACEPGQPVDLGALLAPEPARLQLQGPTGSSATCSFVFRGDAVELHCEVEAPANAQLRLRDGEYLIQRKVGDDAVSRRLRVDAGSTTDF